MGVNGAEVAAASREPARGLFVIGVSMKPGATLFLSVSCERSEQVGCSPMIGARGVGRAGGLPRLTCADSGRHGSRRLSQTLAYGSSLLEAVLTHGSRPWRHRA